MNIFKTLQLVGKCPIVEGFWRNISMAVGLVGVIILLFMAFLFGIAVNWAMMSLLVALLVMAILPIYLPRVTQK